MKRMIKMLKRGGRLLCLLLLLSLITGAPGAAGKAAPAAPAWAPEETAPDAAEAPASPVTLLVCATGEDFLGYLAEYGPAESMEYMILQEADEKEKNRILQAAPEGTEPRFLKLKAIRDSKATENALKKNWGTEKARRLIATEIRRVYPDRIGVFSLQESRANYLESALPQWLQDAADLSFRSSEKTDTFLVSVPKIWDPRTGETRSSGMETLRETAEARWGGPPESFLAGREGLGEDGFMATDEVILAEDPKEGRWAFVSEDLHIEITRKKSKNPALTWYESDVRVRPGSEEYLRCFRFANGKANRPRKLAEETGLVWGINTDFYQYRTNKKVATGLIIRGGEVKSDTSGKTDRLDYLPSLDTLLLTREGTFRLDRAGTLNAEQALAAGATDVLSFGPILVLDGKLRAHSGKIGRALEPRTAIGCYEPGHYLALTVEGRQSSSRGVNMTTLGQMMLAKGVTQAINLDGGHTSVVMFLGKQLNTIGGLNGTGTSASRNLFELLGAGVYFSPDSK